MKQTVYIPVGRDTVTKLDPNITLVEYLKHCSHVESSVYTPADYFIINEGVPISVGGLERTETNIFSDSELLALKKKWMAEGFDSGYSRCFWRYIDGSASTEVPNKQSFLNSIEL